MYRLHYFNWQIVYLPHYSNWLIVQLIYDSNWQNDISCDIACVSNVSLGPVSIVFLHSDHTKVWKNFCSRFDFDAENSTEALRYWLSNHVSSFLLKLENYVFIYFTIQTSKLTNRVSRNRVQMTNRCYRNRHWNHVIIYFRCKLSLTNCTSMLHFSWLKVWKIFLPRCHPNQQTAYLGVKSG